MRSPSPPPLASDLTEAPSPTIGIVGGMGQDATNEFARLISTAKGVLELPINPGTQIDNTPKPDRSACLLETDKTKQEEKKTQLIDELTSGCKTVAHGHDKAASVIFMPCNTAHAYYQEVNDNSPAPIISLIEITKWYIKSQYPGTEEVGLLATNGTVISKKVYHPLFIESRISIVTPAPGIQQSVMDAIYDPTGVKNGIKKVGEITNALDSALQEYYKKRYAKEYKYNKAEHTVTFENHPHTRFKNAIKQTIEEGRPKIWIAGCTEVPLALSEQDIQEEGIILIDPMKIAALAAVIIANDKEFAKAIADSNKPGGKKLTNEEIKTLAFKTFTEGARKITKKNMLLLQAAAAEIPPEAPKQTSEPHSPAKHHDSSSDGDSDYGPDTKLLTSGQMRQKLKPYKCIVEEKTSGTRHGNEPVLRIKLQTLNGNAPSIEEIVSLKDTTQHLEKFLMHNIQIQDRLGRPRYLTATSESRLHSSQNRVTIPDCPETRKFLKETLDVDITEQKEQGMTKV